MRRHACFTLAVAALLAGWGCTDDAALEAQRARLEAAHEARMGALEQLESRLLAARAIQTEWSELQARHEQVTEFACANVAEHVAAMERHEEKQKTRQRTQRRRYLEAQAKAARHGDLRTAAAEGM